MPTLTDNQYNSLILAARGDTTIDVDKLERAINQANDIKRFNLWIRWYTVGGSTALPFDLDNWPADQQYRLIQTRAIAREDVDAVLRANGQNAIDPMVTFDPRGKVGWTELDVYDFDYNNKPM